MSFDWFISDRTITKDNHRPCIPNPLDQMAALPPQKDIPIVDWSTIWQNENKFPMSVQLPTCENLRKQ